MATSRNFQYDVQVTFSDGEVVTYRIHRAEDLNISIAGWMLIKTPSRLFGYPMTTIKEFQTREIEADES